MLPNEPRFDEPPFEGPPFEGPPFEEPPFDVSPLVGSLIELPSFTNTSSLFGFVGKSMSGTVVVSSSPLPPQAEKQQRIILNAKIIDKILVNFAFIGKLPPYIINLIVPPIYTDIMPQTSNIVNDFNEDIFGNLLCFVNKT